MRLGSAAMAAAKAVVVRRGFRGLDTLVDRMRALMHCNQSSAREPALGSQRGHSVAFM